jgi:hypothetical protein
MKLTHNVKVSIDFDEKTMPDYVLMALTNYPESALQELLEGVFIGALDEINALEQINANNSYAKVTWGDN